MWNTDSGSLTPAPSIVSTRKYRLGRGEDRFCAGIGEAYCSLIAGKGLMLLLLLLLAWVRMLELLLLTSQSIGSAVGMMTDISSSLQSSIDMYKESSLIIDDTEGVVGLYVSIDMFVDSDGSIPIASSCSTSEELTSQSSESSSFPYASIDAISSSTSVTITIPSPSIPTEAPSSIAVSSRSISCAASSSLSSSPSPVVGCDCSIEGSGDSDRWNFCSGDSALLEEASSSLLLLLLLHSIMIESSRWGIVIESSAVPLLFLELLSKESLLT